MTDRAGPDAGERFPRRGALAWAVAVCALGVGVGRLEPGSEARFGAGLVLLLVQAWAALVVGERLAAWSDPDDGALARVTRTALFAFAFVVASLVTLGALHAITPAGLAACSALGWLAASGGTREASPPSPVRTLVAMIRAQPAGGALLVLAAALTAVNLAWAALSPVQLWDDFSYHFVMPIEWAQHRTLVAPWIAFGNHSPTFYPKNAELLLTWAFVPVRELGHLTCVTALFLPALAVVLADLARRLGAGAGAALAVAGLTLLSPVAIDLLPSGYVDLPLAFLFAAIVRALLRLRERPAAGGLLELAVAVGLFVGTKVLAVAYLVTLLAPAALVALWPLRARLRDLGARRLLGGLAVGLALVLGLGGWWYLRNWVETGNPLFPMIVEVGGVRLFDGAYGRESVPPSTWRTLGELFVPWWGRAPAWHRALCCAPLVLGALAAAVEWGRAHRRGLAALGVLLPAGGALVFRAIVPFDYARFALPFGALALLAVAAGLDASRAFLRRACWLAVSAAVLASLLQPEQLQKLLLPFDHPTMHLDGLVVLGLALGAGAALVVLPAPWLFPRRIGTLLLLAAPLAAELALVRRASDPYGPHVVEPVAARWRPFERLDRSPRPLRIASAGSTDTLREYGWHRQQHRVRYVSVDASRAGLPERTRALAAEREALRGDRLGWAYYRRDADFDAWLANLRAAEIEVLVVKPLPRWLRRQRRFVRDGKRFPREAIWARQHPRLFQPIVEDPEVRIYFVRPARGDQ